MRGEDLVIYDALSEKGRTLFASRLVRKTIERQQQIIMRGDAVAGAYFVLQGALRVFVYGQNGRETTLYRIEPGGTCILALNALFSDLLYPAWVESEADTVVGLLPGHAYRALFTTEPAIQDLTIRALSSAVFGLMASLEQRAAQSLEQQLVSYLLLRASSEATIYNTQVEIAGQLGSTREVIGRHMARFASQGLLESRRGVIRLLDIKGLNRLLER